MIAGPVLLAADDGPILHGERYDVSADWILFVHDAADSAADLESVRPLFADAQQRDFSVFAVDLQGHGKSEGPAAEDDGQADLRTIVSYVRAAGADSVFLVTVGATAGSALRLADELRPDGLILLSPRLPAGAGVAELGATGVPRLFFVGARDASVAAEVESVHRAARGWSVIINFPTAAQGAGLLADRAHRAQVVNYLTGFLIEQRALLHASPVPRPSPGAGLSARG